MATAVADKKNGATPKVKAERYPITQLMVTAAYAKTYSTGNKGFFGQGIDPATGKKFQIVGAVEIKPNN